MNQPAHPVMTSAGKARFSTAEFLHMAALGAFDDMKVELVDGEIERMNPPMGGHADRQGAIIGQLWAILSGSGARVVGEIGIDLGDDSLLACDVAVAKTRMTENRPLRPADLVLVVEVAMTSLDRDLGMKRRKYAAAGVERYWVVDGVRRVTHVFAQPVDGDYAAISTVAFGEPLDVPGADATIVID